MLESQIVAASLGCVEPAAVGCHAGLAAWHTRIGCFTLLRTFRGVVELEDGLAIVRPIVAASLGKVEPAAHDFHAGLAAWHTRIGWFTLLRTFRGVVELEGRLAIVAASLQ